MVTEDTTKKFHIVNKPQFGYARGVVWIPLEVADP